jgi:hypothetical protein
VTLKPSCERLWTSELHKGPAYLLAQANGTSSNGKSMDDIYKKYGLESQAASFYWQHRPQTGSAYCIYHRRQPSDLHYNSSHEGARHLLCLSAVLLAKEGTGVSYRSVTMRCCSHEGGTLLFLEHVCGLDCAWLQSIRAQSFVANLAIALFHRWNVLWRFCVKWFVCGARC